MGETRVRKSKKKAAEVQSKQQHEVESKLQRLNLNLGCASAPPPPPNAALSITDSETPSPSTNQSCTSNESAYINAKHKPRHKDDGEHTESYVEVKSTPTKGLALFATRKIQPGTLILSETPVIRLTQAEEDADKSNSSSSTTTSVTETPTLETAFRTLSKPSQKQYLTLFDSEKATFTRVKSIYYSNCYNLSGRSLPHPESPGGSCIGILASRINHSCVPNVQFSFDERLQNMQFHAIKPIPRGREILSIYDSVFETRDQRQRKLLLYYGFRCDCEACVPGTNGFWARSDERRRAMVEARRDVKRCELFHGRRGRDQDVGGDGIGGDRGAVDVSYDPTPALERLEMLLVKEGLAGLPLADCYRDMGLWASRKGDVKMLKRASEKELEVCRTCFGEGAVRVRMLREKLER